MISKLSNNKKVKVGVIGLGRGFMLTLPSLIANNNIKLWAACSSRVEARTRFKKDFGGDTYKKYDEMLCDTDLDVVYVATPHEHHAKHAVAALEAGKIVLLEKPMSVSMEDAYLIVEASSKSGCGVIVGPSHSFDPAVLEALSLIKSGDFGKVKLVQSSYHTNFMYRPRRPEELDTSRGGGVIYSQGAHQFDVARAFAGGIGETLIGYTGIWDQSRKSETAYTTIISFQGGAVANLTYSGNDFYDSDIEMNNISELGHKKIIDPGASRRILAKLAKNSEADLKKIRSYQGLEVMRQCRGVTKPADGNEHFGVWKISLEKADLVVFNNRVEVYHEDGKFVQNVATPKGFSRQIVCDALVDLVTKGISPLQTASWALGTLECCDALLNSSKNGSAVDLTRQIPVNGHPNLV